MLVGARAPRLNDPCENASRKEPISSSQRFHVVNRSLARFGKVTYQRMFAPASSHGWAAAIVAFTSSFPGRSGLRSIDVAPDLVLE